MTKYARLDGANTVIETFDHLTLVPSDTHVPFIAAQFIPCPVEVDVKFTFDGEVWTPPEPDNTPEPAAVVPMWITRFAFLSRFLVEERLAIREAAKTNPMIADFIAMVDVSSFIDLSLEDTLQAVNYLATVELITANRGIEILTTLPTLVEIPT